MEPMKIVKLAFLVIIGALAPYAQAQKESTRVGDWIVSMLEDVLTQQKSVNIYTVGLDGAGLDSGLFSVFCNEGVPGAGFGLMQGLLLSSEVSVAYRVGSRPVVQPGKWLVSKDGKFVFPFTYGRFPDVVPFLREVSAGDGEELVIRFSPNTGRSYTLKFSLKGFGDALKYLPCWRP